MKLATAIPHDHGQTSEAPVHQANGVYITRGSTRITEFVTKIRKTQASRRHIVTKCNGALPVESWAIETRSPDSTLSRSSRVRDQRPGLSCVSALPDEARVESMARFYGALGGVTYGEPFLQKEVALVEDLLAIPVKSI
jgi:hypothetical protein